MNAKFIHRRFAESELIRYPKLTDWKKMEFFIFAEFLIKERKFNDSKYVGILKTIAAADLGLSGTDLENFTHAYLEAVRAENKEFISFGERYSTTTNLAKAVELYDIFGNEGMRLLAERRFTSRPVQAVERLLNLHASQVSRISDKLGNRFDQLESNRKFAELGLLLVKKKSFFGANLSKDLVFFLWFLDMALDQEDYAVRYLSGRTLEELERSYLSILRKSGGLHQTVLRLHRDIRIGLVRFN
jgi:hypothetical protein